MSDGSKLGCSDAAGSLDRVGGGILTESKRDALYESMVNQTTLGLKARAPSAPGSLQVYQAAFVVKVRAFQNNPPPRLPYPSFPCPLPSVILLHCDAVIVCRLFFM